MAIQNIQWSKDLSVGIDFLDEDHKKLVNLLSTLFTACFVGAGDSVVGKTLTELEDYTHYHFDNEEKFLAQHNYPQFVAHKLEHQKLIAELHEYTARIREQGSAGMDLEVETFLRNWLINHICDHDKHYAKFMEEQK